MSEPRWGAPRDREAPTLRTLGRAAVDGAPASLPDVIGGRYRRTTLLGRGGMGEVWQVEDRVLQRRAALKVVRPELVEAESLRRFTEEGRISAQLQHPGIIPIYDLGTLDDGRVWFTMKEVRGRTLAHVSGECHAQWRLGALEAVGFRRLFDVFHRVCETIAFAHAQGVLHRDLKPSNIMVGEFGEVLVLDWGLARRATEPSGRSGAVGTPAYMAPEQVRGDTASVGPWSDTYALGAILYELLADRPPRLGKDVAALLARVAEGAPFPAPRAIRDVPPVDPALEEICLRALSTEPSARYPHAEVLARDVGAWLDGTRRREVALGIVAEADTLLAEAAAADAAAIAANTEAEALERALPRNADPAHKGALWAAQDAAAEARARAVEARAKGVERLRTALTHADVAVAHARLAAVLHDRVVACEADPLRGDEAKVAAMELARHDHAGRYAAFLRGTGALTLHTDPPGADVVIFPQVERGRRLVDGEPRLLGQTPIDAAPVEMGRYIAELRRDGFAPTRVPFVIGRQEHHDGVPPEGGPTLPLPLLPLGALGPGEIYVPPGWFWAGDDIFDHTLPIGRWWADGFVIGRDPVTVGDWLDWLDALVEAGDEAAVQAAVPLLGDTDEPYFSRRADGLFEGPRADVKIEGWELFPRDRAAPVTCVTWHQARAYADWRAARTGLPWRLPMEREWQKAARGGDRRRYPWGDHLEPAWCQMRQSEGPVSRFVRADERPLDVSPYGVRGLAGNVSDWVLDPVPYTPAGPRVEVVIGSSVRRSYMGGNCGAGFLACSTAQRTLSSAASSALRVGFRLARTIA